MAMPELCIQVVSVPVSDQDRAKAFYLEKLGFEEVSDAPYGEGMRWVEVRPAGSPISLTLVTWFPSMPAGSLQGLVIDTQDVQEAYTELMARGVHFAHEPRKEVWGTFTTFTDPDGNGFVLAQAAPRQES
jgi:catechol 2,3-dioxygenase-like lactoylglutathione lyase family enzyme